ncbi:MAG: CBS domain-containing protein [Planctomycetaceae bacterium]|nr:CBS domain-containing protein [Planctomycetaceae bacterium]
MHGEPNGTSRQPRDNGAHGDGDRTRIARFEGAYNRIDREMQRLLDEPREGRRRGFASAVRQIASERRHFGRHLDFLLEAGELRNALVHNRFGDIEYIAVPTEATVARLEAIDEELRSPVQLRTLAAREVVTISIDEKLGRVLALVRQKGVVRFPVKRDGKIMALLTASGVVRWIASHDLESCALPASVQVPRAPAGSLDAPVSKAPAGAETEGERIICAIASVSVGEVLARDHRRDEFALVPRTASADEALSLWSKNPRLEAVIVTERGRAEEAPLGIATATDLIKLLETRA